MSHSDRFEIRHSPLGSIVVPIDSTGTAPIFWTTNDFDGRIDDISARKIVETIRELGGGAEQLQTCTQVHGTEAVEAVDQETGWSECSSCDAIWTRREDVALGIKVADCLPVSMIDSNRDAGLAINLHAGWRGAAAGIVAKTLAEVRREEPISTYARAWLGPSIRVCCFEVGEEVVDAFRSTQPWVDEFVDRSRSRPHVDLAGIVTRSLVEEGFARNRIWDAGLCTRCPDSIFHSFRRSGPRAGRNLAVIGRRPV